jgi:hypothetical protein
MLEKMRQQTTKAPPGPIRLSVVLDETLSEHVRLRAFQTRKSRSRYVRDLLADDMHGRPLRGMDCR